MPYVTVPVPEEHVEDVMQFILRETAKASLAPWGDESISALFHEVDEASRSLIAYAARATVSGKEISDAQAADLMQIRQREIAGIMRELNERATKANRPPRERPHRHRDAAQRPDNGKACARDERRGGAPRARRRARGAGRRPCTAGRPAGMTRPAPRPQRVASQ